MRFHSDSVLHVEREFAALGVHLKLLRWLPLLDRRKHVQRASAAELSLDTPGYNQGTSGLDAIWAGLAPVSLPFRLWCGRMGASLLRKIAVPSAEVHGFRSLSDILVALIVQPLTSPRIDSLPLPLSDMRRRLHGRNMAHDVFKPLFIEVGSLSQ